MAINEVRVSLCSLSSLLQLSKIAKISWIQQAKLVKICETKMLITEAISLIGTNWKNTTDISISINWTFRIYLQVNRSKWKNICFDLQLISLVSRILFRIQAILTTKFLFLCQQNQSNNEICSQEQFCYFHMLEIFN